MWTPRYSVKRKDFSVLLVPALYKIHWIMHACLSPPLLINSTTGHYNSTGMYSTGLWSAFLASVQQGRALERGQQHGALPCLPEIHWKPLKYGCLYNAEKMVSVHLRAGSASAERVGQREVGWFTRTVTCTWWLLGLALKGPWLGLGGPPAALTTWTGLENTSRGLVSGKEGCLGSEWVYDNL